ncbi:ATP-binding cassette domain-containing protein [Nakamurella sp. YIM 132087]|uniref:ATP-binding cassette domain-containing protein n=1 Tax=Nakamurella alba TaxID=2665158 RepID=A0A7K1FMT3_9ACTN|nr:ABC transporter ATP-binding protein [Nakamurella alba]MTD15475.1 ATP-binding cassette domain-containing protein [Nakamurella alba]
MSDALLEVTGLSLDGPGGREILRDVSFAVDRGEIVGLVGESGSGKSMTSLALTGLLPPAIVPVAGAATLAGDPYLTAGRTSVRPRISIVFQNPRGALNPTMRIGAQVIRLLRSRGQRRAGAAQVEELLLSVGIDDPERVRRSYPHELSGGMNQRVMIGLAIAADPELLIADEPTTGLDVTVQAQILDLFRRTTSDSNRGVLFITHDLGVVAQMCTRVVVLYRGRIVETGSVDDIFHAPTQQYTQDLVAAATAVHEGRAAGREVAG